ncbi:hypothetical protein [Virgibacillus sp. DJP39]|uniref:hypothetical protein n=1 Tax=Virgibacillus sp. DJP39 TaxID=3409790 RepID=UPI003BB6E3A4
MELFFMFFVAIIVLVLAVIAIIVGLKQRIKNPTNDLKEKITNLEKRVDDIENNR